MHLARRPLVNAGPVWEASKKAHDYLTWFYDEGRQLVEWAEVWPKAEPRKIIIEKKKKFIFW